MRPRGLVEPLDAAPRAYFSAAQIEKAEAYRTGQLWLFGARMVIELGVLAFIVAKPPRVLQIPHVTGMEEIKDAIGEHDRSTSRLHLLRKPRSGIDRMAGV